MITQKKKDISIEYMCRLCGIKSIKKKSHGRPLPGTCPRRKTDGPHSWVKNRELP